MGLRLRHQCGFTAKYAKAKAKDAKRIRHGAGQVGNSCRAQLAQLRALEEAKLPGRTQCPWNVLA